MTAKKKAAAGKGEIKKLKLKKVSIRDLDLKNEARDLKGGTYNKTYHGCA